MLTRCQGSRINDQRCDAPDPTEAKSRSADDLLELVAKLQGDRMDEQRFELRDPEDIEGVTTESKKLSTILINVAFVLFSFVPVFHFFVLFSLLNFIIRK